MAVSYGAQCISILIISYVLHITMHFDNCSKSHGGAVRPNSSFPANVRKLAYSLNVAFTAR